MKVISFCLWGNNPKYCVGAIKNAELAKTIYPDWECWYYVSADVPGKTPLNLSQQPNCKVIFYDAVGDWRMMLDRFRPISEANVEVMISRDCDSRLSLREKEAVDQWLQSDKSFHTMHCHFHHSVPILGGMFGIKKGLFSEMSRHAMEWAQSHEARWQVDQDFLKDVVWPIVKNDTMNHADFHTNFWPGIPFPSPIEPGHFIGATYDENDNIDQTQLKQLYG